MPRLRKEWWWWRLRSWLYPLSRRCSQRTSAHEPDGIRQNSREPIRSQSGLPRQHEGLQYSVLGPAHIPDNLDFQAATYGSHTECRMVTTQCGAVSDFGARVVLPLYLNFACNSTMAGLNMTGNFANLGQRKESYLGSQQNESSTPPALKEENLNTMSQSDFGFGFQYFNDSAKQQQVPQVDTYGLGLDDDGPITNTTNQYFWAMAFTLDIQLNIENAIQNPNPWRHLNLVATTQGGAEGIISCETNISEIARLTYLPPIYLTYPFPLEPPLYILALFPSPSTPSPYTCPISFPSNPH